MIKGIIKYWRGSQKIIHRPEKGQLEVSCHGGLVARLDEKVADGTRSEVTAFWWLSLAKILFPGDVFVEAKSQRFGASLWREGGIRESCVSVSEITWCLVSARKWFSGVGC